MRLPTPLLRRRRKVHKNTFGHVLVLAGSRQMLGAAALTSLAAIRSGTGLVTSGIPSSLNNTLQKKIAPVIMTLPLRETTTQSIAFAAAKQIEKIYAKYQAIAIGPGLSNHPSTKRFIQKIIATSSQVLVIDADALNAIADDLDVLTQTKTPKILTPHPGEMGRLLKSKNIPKKITEKQRINISQKFANRYHCIVLLKGHCTIVAGQGQKAYRNRTGNPGMATAGSGDVLTGMIAAFLAQGMTAFDAAKYGAYLHGKAGDIACHSKTPLTLIATDIIDAIPQALKRSR